MTASTAPAAAAPAPSLTKEQWAEVEQNLGSPYGYARLRCDGHELGVAIERHKGLRYVVAVYIDGYIRAKDMDGEAEHVRKFWRERKHYLYGPKERAGFARNATKRALGAEARAMYARMADAHFVRWEPWWPNAKAFVRHLRKSCTSIELLPREH